MIHRIIKLTGFGLFLCCFSTFVMAAVKHQPKPLQCLMTVTKKAAWSQESVEVKIVDFSTKQILETIVLAAATKTAPSVNSLTQAYNCIEHPIVQLEASYTPSIWSTDIGKIYSGKNIYNLTKQIFTAQAKNIKKLEIMANFPGDFLSVPMVVN